LTFRRARVSDFEAGYSFVSARHGYNPAIRKDVLKLWGILVENGHDPIAVVEDRDQPPAKRLVGFGTSFFAHDWFVQEAKTTLPPFLDLQVIEKWRGGKRPFLLREEITDAQLRGGLNAVAFNWGMDTKRYGPEGLHKIGMTQSQSYIAIVSGYRLKEFLQEQRGPEARDLLMNFGVDLYRDYREFLGTMHLPPAIGEQHPYLMGALFEEVRKDKKKAGTAIDRMARMGPPKFGFQANEQEVLKRALMGETDEEITESLHLTLVTVKRRWQAIYAKVTAVDAGFLGDGSDLEPEKNAGQKQRRRFLIKNLADHPEELWPTPPAKKKHGQKNTKN
jgi:hypothetical protein